MGIMGMAVGGKGCVAREKVPDIGEGWEGSERREEGIGHQGTEVGRGEGHGGGQCRQRQRGRSGGVPLEYYNEFVDSDGVVEAATIVL